MVGSILVGLFLWVHSGVSGEAQTAPASGRIRIAVLDLKNESPRPDPRLARYFADRLTFELLAARRYDLVDRGEIAHVLQKDSIPIGQDLSVDQILTVGKGLGVDVLVMGTISEYDEGDIDIAKGRAGIYAKLVSARDGSLLGMARYRKQGGSDMIALSEEVTYQIARGLVKKLKSSERLLYAQRKAAQTAGPRTQSSPGSGLPEQP
jgi:TolB-like protein